MASVIAVVSKAVFEKQAKGLAPGSVWAATEYLSTNRGLQPLADGGSLFLCTVRPPDEQLWLVAILESPTFGGDRWSATANTVPITDRTAAIPSLRFATGTGVTAEPGKLAMSMQTPRVLTADDEALLRGSAKPERAPVPVAVAPTSDVQKIVAQARKAPGKAVTAARALAKRLGHTPEAIAACDAISAGLLADKPETAGEVFAIGRATERKLGLKPDLAGYQALAAAGGLDPKEVEALVRHLRKGKAPLDRAVLVELALASARCAPPTAGLVRAVADTHPGAEEEVVRGWIAAHALRGVMTDLWEAAHDAVIAVLRSDPASRQWASRYVPKHSIDGGPWSRIIADFDLVANVDWKDADTLVDWVERWIRSVVGDGRVGDDRLATLAQALPSIVAVVRRHDRALSLVSTWGKDPYPDGDGLLSLHDPEVVEVLLAHDAPLVPLDDPGRYVFTLYGWGGRTGDRPTRGLPRLAADPILGLLLVRSFVASARTSDDGANHLALAVGYPFGAAVCAEVERWVRGVADAATLGTLDEQSGVLERLARGEILGVAPGIAAALRSIGAAQVLARQLRAGLLDEWGWPAHDQAGDRLGVDIPFHHASGNLPYVVLLEKDSGRVVAAGPDGVIAEQTVDGDPRAFRVVGGEFLAVGWNSTSRWLPDGQPIPSATFANFGSDLADGDSVVTPGGRVRRGQQDLSAWHRGWGKSLWADADGCWLVGSQVRVSRDGAGVGPHNHDRNTIRTMDPETGEPGDASLPPWIREQMTPDSVLQGEFSWSFRVPSGSEDSPLGARDGVGAFAAVVHADGSLTASGIDGRRWRGRAAGHVPIALMRFPERDALYPVIQQAFDLGVVAPDGVNVLCPVEARLSPRYWGGGPHRLPLAWWHLLRPRDPAGSRALRDCSDDAAATIFAVARSITARGASPGGGTEVLEGYEGLHVEIEHPPETGSPLIRWPAVADAVRAALPAVSHPRLVAGITAVAMTCAEIDSQALARIREKVDATGDGPASPNLVNGDVPAFALLVGVDIRPWWVRSRNQLGAQIVEASTFLFEDRPVPAVKPLTRAVSDTVLPWSTLITDGTHLLWRLLAPGTPDDARADLARLLELWATTGFAAHPDTVRVVDLGLDPLTGMDNDHPARLAEWESRYFLRLGGSVGSLRAVEVSRDGRFHTPPGTRSLTELPSRPATAAAIVSATRLLAERGPFRLDIDVHRLAERTGLLPPTAALLWAGAAKPWPADAAFRKRLGFTAAELEVGRIELGRLDTGPVYAAAMTEDPAALYLPEAVDRLADAWNQTWGRRPAVPLEAVVRATEDLRDDGRADLELRALAHPESHPMLARDETWVVRPYGPFDAAGAAFRRFTTPAGWPKPRTMGEEDQYPNPEQAFSGYVFRQLVRYLSWAHLELPAGDPLAASIAAAADAIDARLANPELLILAGCVDLSRAPFRGAADFAELARDLVGPAYRAADGGAAAPGVDHGAWVATWPTSDPNGVFLAVRPARAGSVPLRFEGFQPVALGRFPWMAGGDLEGLRVWQSDGFRALVKTLREPGLVSGRFAADPRASAPARVAALRDTHDLDEDAATLLLQVRTLAEPLPARLLRYNGWKKPTLDAAARRLLDRQLLVAGSYARSTRKWFVPGPVVIGEAPAAPMEASKLASYGFGDPWRSPFGVALPLRPLSELFGTLGDP